MITSLADENDASIDARRGSCFWAHCGILFALLVGCDQSDSDRSQPLPLGVLASHTEHLEPIEPLTEKLSVFDAKAKLGKLLFHDVRLSGDNSISCASCHDVRRGGDDDRQYSIGVGGAIGSVNSPTVLNAALNLAQFWDGRARTLENQVQGPIHATNEMASSWPEIVSKLKADDAIGERFRALYPEGITAETITDCIVRYERCLTTPNAPFDRYLQGDRDAVSEDVLEGYRLFKELGCASCHQGKGVGGNLFEQFGVMQDFFLQRRAANSMQSDAGRFNVTQLAEDFRRFKVPSLRNVELTAPYLHDGSAQTLEEAVAIMGIYQLGSDISTDEIKSIVKFLRSLTGELDEELK